MKKTIGILVILIALGVSLGYVAVKTNTTTIETNTAIPTINQDSGNIILSGTIENTGIIENTGATENNKSNTFNYKNTKLSMELPIGRTAEACKDGKDVCGGKDITITTDQKDDKEFPVYIVLTLEQFDANSKLLGDKSNIEEFGKSNTSIIDEPNKKIIQREASGLGSFIAKINGKYFYIEIYDITSEQPRPDINDAREPNIPNIENIRNQVISIIKSIK